jgi:hypothetical protein
LVVGKAREGEGERHEAEKTCKVEMKMGLSGNRTHYGEPLAAPVGTEKVHSVTGGQV